jgi:nicotinate-nucleotide adenylyltransferase
VSQPIRRIGVFGGTFDPPHLGHLVAAQGALCQLDLEHVLWTPAGRPPHKPGRPISSAEDRVAMVERAIAGNPRFILCRADLDAPGPCYTASLLERLSGQLGPGAQLYFIAGMDSLRDLLTWHQPARVLELAFLAAATRPGCEADLAALEASIPGATGRIVRVDIPALDISSTDLQRRIRAGESVRYLTPDAVAEYIASRGLYRSTEPQQPAAGA